MASLNVKLDTRRANTNGDYPVKLVISNNQTDAYISLNIDLPERAWIKNGIERPVKTSHPGARIINDKIQSLFIEFRKKISDLELSGFCRTSKASDIKKRLLEEKAVILPVDVFFSDYALKYADSCRSSRTGRNYIYTVSKLKEYACKENICFEDITLQFLRDFDNYLSKLGSGVNTRSIHFRNIRAVFNRAIDDDVIKHELYPFRKFKIKSEEKDKVNLTPEQVKQLYEYEFETPSLRMARDFWMLSFFLCGVNPIDLYHLKKPDANGVVSFVRRKEENTNHYVIKFLVQPEAANIINVYKAEDDSPFLLKFESKYVNYDIFKSFLSKKIREIAKITGLSGLTLYWARYSWATIADSIGIQEKTISKGLGHTDKSLAGRKYIAFDWSKVDRANRQVIDFVLYSG